MMNNRGSALLLALALSVIVAIFAVYATQSTILRASTRAKTDMDNEYTRLAKTLDTIYQNPTFCQAAINGVSFADPSNPTAAQSTTHFASFKVPNRAASTNATDYAELLGSNTVISPQAKLKVCGAKIYFPFAATAPGYSGTTPKYTINGTYYLNIDTYDAVLDFSVFGTDETFGGNPCPADPFDESNSKYGYKDIQIPALVSLNRATMLSIACMSKTSAAALCLTAAGAFDPSETDPTQRCKPESTCFYGGSFDPDLTYGFTNPLTGTYGCPGDDPTDPTINGPFTRQISNTSEHGATQSYTYTCMRCDEG